jgi:hypothetical protein
VRVRVVTPAPVFPDPVPALSERTSTPDFAATVAPSSIEITACVFVT